MGIRQAVWRIGAAPIVLADAKLPSEQLLEDMIVAEPSILSDEWMLIGRQVWTAHAGRIDLLAVQPDGALVLIELKRDKTPREVVAQAIDYASWVEKLDSSAVAAIFSRFRPETDFREAFAARFGTPLDESTLNYAHEIVVVSATLDDSSERIVRYLNDRGIAINVLSFQVFEDGAGQLLTRAWLLDPAKAQDVIATSAKGKAEPWNGEYYASFGAGRSRSWEEARRYGFISAGGGSWYTKTLGLLAPGDRVWVRVPQVGYVGVARVVGEAQPMSEFIIDTADGPLPATRVLSEGEYHMNDALTDPSTAEWFVPVNWLDTRALGEAFNEVGLFGNQNTVSRPVTQKWRHTIERLKVAFRGYERDSDTDTALSSDGNA